MEISHLNALRLGFCTKQSGTINKSGISRYISKQLSTRSHLSEPDFIRDGPKNLDEYQQLRKKAAKGEKESEKIAGDLNKMNAEWKAFVIKRCFETELPLQEKINLFFQNHFVVTLQSVKVPYWIYKHYETIHNHSLGNYKTLVKEMVYTNAMIKYLDNFQNRKGKINENPGR